MSIIINPGVPNCLRQDLQFECLECVNQYYLDIIEKKCIPICPENCQICSYPTHCDVCQEDYQYTTENLCVLPINNSIDLRISDEQLRKGKPRLLIIENELIIIYGIQGETDSYLRIKKLTSLGLVQMERDLFDNSSQLRDYSITSGDNDSQFRLLIKWFENGFGKIIEYNLRLEDLTIITEKIFLDNIIADMNGDQILINKIQNLGISEVYYFYLTFNSQDNLYHLNQKTQNQQNTYDIGSYTEDGLQLFSIEILNGIILSIKSSLGFIIFTCQNICINISQLNFNQVELIEQKYFYIDQENYFFIDLDELNNFQLFFNFKEHKMQVTQTSRNPKSVCGTMAGKSNVFVAWLGYSNIENSQQIEQVYLQRINLETYSVEDIKKVICSRNCINCNDEGQCLQCKNKQYQLINERCKLLCQDNCGMCEIENQCLVCQSSYYLNSNLQCVLDEQNYLSSFDNITEMNLYYSNENLITVYLKQNSTRLDVILEEFKNGESVSGELRISSDDDYLIVQKQPKVIKKGFYYFVTYLTRLITGNYQRVFVILNDAYQLCSRNFLNYTETSESDIFVTDSLNIYCFSFINQYCLFLH